ncbi:MAG: hypothetical protein HYY14_05255 [Candidatus Omnitrophica bacterium]|nr:hypothetical protein [Candidatus Omnitrophota bacterium]
MRRLRRALLVVVFVVSATTALAYWMVRGIPLTGRLEGWVKTRLSRALGVEVSFDQVLYHPPGVLTLANLSVTHAGEPGLAFSAEAARLSAQPLDMQKGIQFDLRGVTVGMGEVTSPRVPRARARIVPQGGGVSWQNAEAFFPMFGQPARFASPSGFVKLAAEAQGAWLFEYQTECELQVRSLALWTKVMGNERAAELVGRLGSGPGDARELAATLEFGDGKAWIDPLRLGDWQGLECELDFRSSTLTFSKADGGLRVSTRFHLAEDKLDGEIHLNHWMLARLDIVSRSEFSLDWSPATNPHHSIRGEMRSPSLVVNLKPVDPLSCDFVWGPEGLVISRASWGDEFGAQGRVDVEKQELDFSIALLDADLDHLTFGLEEFEGERQGRATGTVTVKGPARLPEVEGDIVVKDGKRTDLGPFDSINLHMRGRGARWDLYDSTIYKETGSFLLTGWMGFDSSGLVKHLDVHGHEGVMVLSGWDVTGDDRMVEAGKEIGDRFKVGLKAYLDEDSMARDERDEFAVEYGLSDRSSVEMRLRGEDQVLGVKQKKRF